MQIETSMRYHLIPTKMAKIKKTVTILCVGVDMEQLEFFYTAGENAKWYNDLGKTLGNL